MERINHQHKMFIYSHRRGDWKRSECPFKLVISRQLLKKKNSWDFPGSPVVKTLLFHCRGVGLSPGQGIKILHALMSRPKLKKKKKKSPNASSTVGEQIEHREDSHLSVFP